MYDTRIFEAFDWVWKNFPDLAIVAIILYAGYRLGVKGTQFINYIKGLGDRIDDMDKRLATTDRELRTEIKNLDERVSTRLHDLSNRMTRVENILIKIDSFLTTNYDNYPHA